MLKESLLLKKPGLTRLFSLRMAAAKDKNLL